MRWSPPRSLAAALAGLALGALPWAALARLHGQAPPPPAAPDPDADLTKRVERLDSPINQRLDAGQIAEAVPPAREKLDLLTRTRGQNHWQTGDARRSLETYQRLTSLPREVQDRYVKSRQTNARAEQLYGRGQYAEAALLFQEALTIRREILGEAHPDTAESYNDLGAALEGQGKYAEAEAMHRRALAILLEALGAGHPDTASSYNNLAETLLYQGKHAEAEAMHRRALAIRLEALGAGHPDTATTYNNLARTLGDQGKSAEAEAMFRRALAIWLKAQGAGHPLTAGSYNNLARSLDRQGKHDDALRILTSAAASYEQARLRGAKGLEAALTAGASPLPSFALALARAGRPRDAWTRWEQGLARGLIDEVAGRAARPLTAAEHDQEVLLLGQAQALDERIGRLLAARALSQEQDKLLEDLKRQASEIRRQVLELEQQFETRYGALAGRPATLEAVQKALPGGTALVGWIDRDPYHWACLLRHSGDPVWVRLPGSGKDGGWTKEEQERTQRLRAELDLQTTRGHARPLAAALARQRLEPIKPHLQGVNRLVVVNSPGLAGVPLEVLLAARPDPAWDGLTVSYAPSASMFAYLVGKPTPRDRDPPCWPWPIRPIPSRSPTPSRPHCRMRGWPSRASSPTATPISTASTRGMSC
jgi:tetratricopeptide (TPR) repeat protein